MSEYVLTEENKQVLLSHFGEDYTFLDSENKRAFSIILSNEDILSDEEKSYSLDTGHRIIKDTKENINSLAIALQEIEITIFACDINTRAKELAEKMS